MYQHVVFVIKLNRNPALPAKGVSVTQVYLSGSFSHYNYRYFNTLELVGVYYNAQRPVAHSPGNIVKFASVQSYQVFGIGLQVEYPGYCIPFLVFNTSAAYLDLHSECLGFPFVFYPVPVHIQERVEDHTAFANAAAVINSNITCTRIYYQAASGCFHERIGVVASAGSESNLGK